MQSENLMKCAHDSCRCLVETEDEFCSASCAEAKDTGSPCGCGHSDCTVSDERMEGNWRQVTRA